MVAGCVPVWVDSMLCVVVCSDVVCLCYCHATLSVQTSSNDGDSWAELLPYRGVRLNALKIICAPTPSQSQCATLTGSPTQSQTRSSTATRSQSQSRTDSQSASQTQSSSQSVSATQSQTPSQSVTSSQSATISLSPSQLVTRSGTPSQTQSQTATGLPHQAVLDNTAVLMNAINATSSRVLATSVWRAFSFFLPETDPVCGPGIYRLETLSLSLGLANGSVSLAVLLYPASSSTFKPLAAFIRSTVLSVGPVQPSPAYFSLPLPANWLLNATQLRYFSIIVRTTSSTVGWFDVIDNTTAHVPIPGFAQPVGAYMSADVGASWAPEASYAGLALMGRKLVCR
jgi:hypothetical protein